MPPEVLAVLAVLKGSLEVANFVQGLLTRHANGQTITPEEAAAATKMAVDNANAAEAAWKDA